MVLWMQRKTARELVEMTGLTGGQVTRLRNDHASPCSKTLRIIYNQIWGQNPSYMITNTAFRLSSD